LATGFGTCLLYYKAFDRGLSFFSVGFGGRGLLSVGTDELMAFTWLANSYIHKF
jgi:hypothetical protein